MENSFIRLQNDFRGVNLHVTIQYSVSEVRFVTPPVRGAMADGGLGLCPLRLVRRSCNHLSAVCLSEAISLVLILEVDPAVHRSVVPSRASQARR